MKKLLIGIIALLVAAMVATAAVGAYLALVVYPALPAVGDLAAYVAPEPLRIYSADGSLLGEYGIERRISLKLGDMPDVLKLALLAAEDGRFYEHDGVDVPGMLRAAVANFAAGGKRQGASTITMQLARNFYLSNEKTYTRKLVEVLLALKIEAALPKDEILQLYMNQIYLGRRAYGFGAAAQAYFGTDVRHLTLGQAALLAGLPKAPSSFNPIANPERAAVRRRYVLGRMLDLHFITPEEFDAALAEPPYQPPAPGVDNSPAGMVAETVRRLLYDEYGDRIYESGMRVWTTVDMKDQQAAYAAVLKGVQAYTHRHPYAGPEGSAPPQALRAALAKDDGPATAYLASLPRAPGQMAALVLRYADKSAALLAADGRRLDVSGKGLAFVRTRVARGPALKPGDLVRLRQDAPDAEIVQFPQVQAALVAVSPADGAIRALVSGNGTGADQLNRVTQSWRQPGSAFKPFVYAAALAKGMGPATLADDTPLEIASPSARGAVWRPKESGALLGRITLREAVVHSKNLVALRVLQDIGPAYAKRYAVDAFGFDADRIPANLPMALGAGEVTPLQLAAGYAILANGGYKVDPYLIQRITDASGKERFRATPRVASRDATQVISTADSYLVADMLRSAAQRGTGSATNALKRRDIAGKTGTTNAYRDGWFAGFQPDLATVAWMGFDAPRSMGPREYGSRNALPIWVDFMRAALATVKESPVAAPAGITLIDGEPYDDAHLPGSGFIDHIGDALPPGAVKAGSVDSIDDLLRMTDQP